jgi:uncharacterized protein YigA (DUF484 family)
MSDRHAELEARRKALIAQSARQREELHTMVLKLKERLAGVDHGIDVARSFVRKPAVIAGVIAFLSLIGPRRILRAVSKSAVFITTGRRVLSMFRGRKSKQRGALPRSPWLSLPRAKGRS